METNHAADNARGHAEELASLYRIAQWAGSDSYDEARELAWEDRSRLRELTNKGDDLTSTADRSALREACEEQAREQPLSVQVRSGWRNPWEQDNEPNEPEEWQILLSTGGPALRVFGSFDRHGNPCRPVLQYQDWGTPWADAPTSGEEDEALTWLACLLIPC